ncbi:AbrB/MazE/SpoVT family DNA-binding domain-containing protein [Pseudanabaena biceps]|nr:AbrB/MazE/SpoVT family DNA-binding domain-containing protein [Pseudanabaena biceps]
MLEVTLSQQYQISIPQEIRDLLNLHGGQKLEVWGILLMLSIA